MAPQTLTMTSWPLPLEVAQALGVPLVAGHLPLGIMCQNSPNIQLDSLVLFAAYIMRELGCCWGLEKASEIVLAATTQMKIKSQFKYGSDNAIKEDEDDEEDGSDDNQNGESWTRN